MKKLLAYTASLSLALSVNFALPAAAYAANGNNDNSSECKTLASALAISQGNCVSALNGNANANELCHFWEGPNGPALFGAPYPFGSFGECVSNINGILHQ